MKTCIHCNQSFLLIEFPATKRTSKYTGVTSTYYGSYCKTCNALLCKKRRQTVTGLFTDAYNGQKISSKQRGHVPPNYSQEELTQWFKKHHQFEKMCEVWIASGYSRWLKPSPDRLDESKPYSLDNLQLVTWGDNAASFKQKKVEIGAGDCVAVNQYADGVLINTYHSISEAARQIGGAPGNILRCCRGEYKTSKGFTWKFLH